MQEAVAGIGITRPAQPDTPLSFSVPRSLAPLSVPAASQLVAGLPHLRFLLLSTLGPPASLSGDLPPWELLSQSASGPLALSTPSRSLSLLVPSWCVPLGLTRVLSLVPLFSTGIGLSL